MVGRQGQLHRHVLAVVLGDSLELLWVLDVHHLYEEDTECDPKERINKINVLLRERGRGGGCDVKMNMFMFYI